MSISLRNSGPQPALLITLLTPELISVYDDPDLSARREELARLVETAGGIPVAEVTQARNKPNPATFFGKGKVEEIAEKASELEVDLVVINHEISPGQQNSLEDAIEVPVVDRTRLILDIFAQRARSREGKLQVELAQLAYLLPRLTGRGQELSRLAGGIGTRGPGETKLETDRRRVRQRMTDLRRDIAEVRKHRGLLRRRRKRDGVPTFALVGYTNAGKSTLLNRITGSDQVSEDKLFATLDPAIRRAELPSGLAAYLVDTVGFVRDLPRQLIAAFRATLEEVVEADFLVHVVDVSHPEWREQVAAVEEVLLGMGVSTDGAITVLNKADRLCEPPPEVEVRELSRPVQVSALTGEGIGDLLRLMDERIRDSRVRCDFDLDYSMMDLIDEIHRHGEIHSEKYHEDGIHLEVTLPRSVANRISDRVHPDHPG
ncbi:MAG: GTPase HflX [Bacillota bacterium]